MFLADSETKLPVLSAASQHHLLSAPRSGALSLCIPVSIWSTTAINSKEFDFIVAPGVDPRAIALDFTSPFLARITKTTD
jgi:hypothetical protein